MATTLYFQSTASELSRGSNDTSKAGAASGWRSHVLSLTRGTTTVSYGVTTPTGPTNGIEAGYGGSLLEEWISDPLAAAVTFSGTVTFGICAEESSAMANASVGVVIERLSNTGAVVSTIVDSLWGTELGTSNAKRSWTATPTSTAMVAGDRVRIRVYFDDNVTTGNMASGYQLTFRFGGPASFPSDSSVQFAEDVVFSSDAQTFEPSGAAASALFGSAVAALPSGSKLAVGASGDVVATGGAVYVLSGTNYLTQQTLSVAGLEALASLGSSVAINSSDGSVIAAGAPGANEGGTNRGAVYVFSGSSYGTQTKLTASDKADLDSLGNDVCLTAAGTKVFAGAPGAGAAGAVYVYSGASYGTQQKITASDLSADESFGISVCCSDDGSILVVGATGANGKGAVYVYTGGSYGTEQKLVPSGLPAGAELGWRVACSADGSVIVAGAYIAGTGGTVYVFSGSGYATETVLTASDAQASDFLGYAVRCSSDGTVILASAPYRDNGGTNLGSLYAFFGPGYTHQRTWHSLGPQANSYIGKALAVTADGTRCFAGSQDADGAGVNSGLMHIVAVPVAKLFLTATASSITDQGAGVDELAAWTTRGNG